jgi:hypothetical protein
MLLAIRGDDGPVGLQLLRLAEDEEPNRAAVVSAAATAAGQERQEGDQDQSLSHCDPLYSVRNQRCATRKTATTGAVAKTAPASNTG